MAKVKTSINPIGVGDIFRSCEELHKGVAEIYEEAADGNIKESKERIDLVIFKLKELKNIL